MKKRSSKKINLNNRRKIILMILLVVILIILFSLIKLFGSIFSNEESVGNLANGGFVCSYKNTTYYNKYDTGIYKYKNGKEENLTTDKASSIEYYNKALYYLVLDSSKVCLRKLDLTTNKVENIKTFNTSIEKYYIENNNIYYISNTQKVGLVKCNISNPEDETLILEEYIQDFVLSNNKIYYTTDLGVLNVIDLDGNNQKELAQENINKIQVLKNWIYFYDSSENALCKIKTNGKARKVVATFVNNDCFNITNRNIYYFESQNKQIFKSALNGKSSVAIVTIDTDITKINFANNGVYYLGFSNNSDNTYKMFRVTKNGNQMDAIDY